ncbi:DUF3265 domain-containing protein, partial [Vibrio vulnificus]|nr:DUF3265 domain-containing protein [Vibrio vulnificus]
WSAVGFGGESGMRKLGLCGTHPLTQRYTLYEESLKIQVKNSSFQPWVLVLRR